MKTETQVARSAFYLGAGGYGAWKAPLHIHQQRRPLPPSQAKGLGFSVICPEIHKMQHLCVLSPGFERFRETFSVIAGCVLSVSSPKVG